MFGFRYNSLYHYFPMQVQSSESPMIKDDMKRINAQVFCRRRISQSCHMRSSFAKRVYSRSRHIVINLDTLYFVGFVLLG